MICVIIMRTNFLLRPRSILLVLRICTEQGCFAICFSKKPSMLSFDVIIFCQHFFVLLSNRQWTQNEAKKRDLVWFFNGTQKSHLLFVDGVTEWYPFCALCHTVRGFVELYRKVIKIGKGEIKGNIRRSSNVWPSVQFIVIVFFYLPFLCRCHRKMLK